MNNQTNTIIIVPITSDLAFHELQGVPVIKWVVNRLCSMRDGVEVMVVARDLADEDKLLDMWEGEIVIERRPDHLIESGVLVEYVVEHFVAKYLPSMIVVVSDLAPFLDVDRIDGALGCMPGRTMSVFAAIPRRNRFYFSADGGMPPVNHMGAEFKTALSEVDEVHQETGVWYAFTSGSFEENSCFVGRSTCAWPITEVEAIMVETSADALHADMIASYIVGMQLQAAEAGG